MKEKVSRLLTNFFVNRMIPDPKNIENPSVRKAYGTLSSVVCMVCNILLFSIKYLAGSLSGSIPMRSITCRTVQTAWLLFSAIAWLQSLPTKGIRSDTAEWNISLPCWLPYSSPLWAWNCCEIPSISCGILLRLHSAGWCWEFSCSPSLSNSGWHCLTRS